MSPGHRHPTKPAHQKPSPTRIIPAEAWEQAFQTEVAPFNPDTFECIIRRAAEFGQIDLGDCLETSWEPLDVVQKVLAPLKVGSMGIGFPLSEQGDGTGVTVSRFPGGTAVGLLSATWDVTPRLGFVLPNATLKGVKAAVSDAIFAVNEPDDWVFCGEDDDVSKHGDGYGVPAQWYGGKELSKNWRRRVTRKR